MLYIFSATEITWADFFYSKVPSFSKIQCGYERVRIVSLHCHVTYSLRWCLPFAKSLIKGNTGRVVQHTLHLHPILNQRQLQTGKRYIRSTGDDSGSRYVYSMEKMSGKLFRLLGWRPSDVDYVWMGFYKEGGERVTVIGVLVPCMSHGRKGESESSSAKCRAATLAEPQPILPFAKYEKKRIFMHIPH